LGRTGVESMSADAKRKAPLPHTPLANRNWVVASMEGSDGARADMECAVWMAAIRARLPQGALVGDIRRVCCSAPALLLPHHGASPIIGYFGALGWLIMATKPALTLDH